MELGDGRGEGQQPQVGTEAEEPDGCDGRERRVRGGDGEAQEHRQSQGVAAGRNPGQDAPQHDEPPGERPPPRHATAGGEQGPDIEERRGRAAHHPLAEVVDERRAAGRAGRRWCPRQHYGGDEGRHREDPQWSLREDTEDGRDEGQQRFAGDGAAARHDQRQHSNPDIQRERSHRTRRKPDEYPGDDVEVPRHREPREPPENQPAQQHRRASAVEVGPGQDGGVGPEVSAPRERQPGTQDGDAAERPHRRVADQLRPDQLRVVQGRTQHAGHDEQAQPQIGVFHRSTT